MTEHANLLFELGTEELPPKALKHLSAALVDEFSSGLKKAKLSHGEIHGFATPRRLGLIVTQCGTCQPELNLERRGPALQAAFDAKGNPTKAAEGFARSCNTSVEKLERVKTDRGEWLYYRTTEAGHPATELLPKIAAQALDRLPIPKRMRWGDSDVQFVRPVHWLAFLHGETIVPCNLLGIDAGRTTYGHRFHHPGKIVLKHADDYAGSLETPGHVIASFSTRRDQIKQQVLDEARKLGGQPDLDDALLDEVAALCEWPIPIAADFEQRFLEVPQEALVLTMKKNQKYFPLFNADGQLMNHFITISNIDSPNPELIREGNERVIRPRLADAMFFWQQDGKKRLEDHLETLKNVVFQQQLGSMYEKSQRVAELAELIAQTLGGDVEMARQAGLLSRCDLMTEMVKEFPEMQGVMGRYQVRRDGGTDALALAMSEFYLPRFSGDELPGSDTGIALSLAERMDTLAGIFAIGQKPTGDKDPFALRRAALGALRIMKEHKLDLPMDRLIESTVAAIRIQGAPVPESAKTIAEIKHFLMERLRGIYQEEGVPASVFHAVSNVSFTSIADFDRRVHAVTQFNALPEAESLSAANKRIHNILKKSEESIPTAVDGKLFQKKEEHELHQQLTDMTKQVTPMLANGEYEETLKALSQLRDSVDLFFDEVMVMDKDPAIRHNRLALLNSLMQLFLQVADVSVLQSPPG